MPRLEVECKRPLSLSTTLVDVPCSVVKHTEHGHNTIRLAVRSLDDGAVRSNVRTVDTDSTRPLGNMGTLFQGFKDTLDGIILHGN